MPFRCLVGSLSVVLRQMSLPTTLYNTLITGLISQDNAVEAESLFKKLVRLKVIQPDVVTYNTIIDGLCKKGHTYMAVTLLKYMQKKGCKPVTVTYSIAIHSLCKDGLVDHALGLFAKMSEKGITPDVITFNSLIQGMCNVNRWEDTNNCYKRWLVGISLQFAYFQYIG